MSGEFNMYHNFLMLHLILQCSYTNKRILIDIFSSDAFGLVAVTPVIKVINSAEHGKPYPLVLISQIHVHVHMHAHAHAQIIQSSSKESVSFFVFTAAGDTARNKRRWSRSDRCFQMTQIESLRLGQISATQRKNILFSKKYIDTN